jgi:hypothetical protein
VQSSGITTGPVRLTTNNSQIITHQFDLLAASKPLRRLLVQNAKAKIEYPVPRNPYLVPATRNPVPRTPFPVDISNIPYLLTK